MRAAFLVINGIYLAERIAGTLSFVIVGRKPGGAAAAIAQGGGIRQVVRIGKLLIIIRAPGGIVDTNIIDGGAVGILSQRPPVDFRHRGCEDSLYPQRVVDITRDVSPPHFYLNHSP